MSEAASGWTLGLRGGGVVAVGARELIYVMPEAPKIHALPLAPPHAAGLLLWGERLVPVLDLGVLFDGAKSRLPGDSLSDGETAHTVVVSIAAAGANQPALIGALQVCTVPSSFEAADDQLCELGDRWSPYRPYFRSCFKDAAHGSVPVLDLQSIFVPPSQPSPQAYGEMVVLE